MAARSIWSGTIGFGMMVIPVKLLPATSGGDSELHRYRRSDASRIRMRRVAEADGDEGREVPWDDTVAGYETGAGTVVLLEDDELDEAYGVTPGEPDRAARITAFTPLGSLPRMAAESSYYVQPGKGGEHAYELLAAALNRAGKAAVVSLALRKRKANALLYATGDGYLVMERLQWASSVQAPSFEAPRAGVTEAEVSQALALMEVTGGEFDWDTAADASAQRLSEYIRARVEAGQVSGTPAVPGAVAAPANLEELLRASVEAARAAQAPAPRKRAPRKPKAVSAA